MGKSKIIQPGTYHTIFDGEGTCLVAVYDKSYKDLFGYTDEEYQNNHDSWTNSFHPEDKERVEALLFEGLKKHPEGMDYDCEYRMMTKTGYRWFHDYARCTRREDGALLRCDGVVFDIDDIKKQELVIAHDQLKTELLEYFVSHEGDPIEMLKVFAEKMRALLNCDQVIYRDLEETRIMVNSEGIANTWSVPIEYCRQCQHFNAHHPMYKDGYTLMNNCQEGWQGIPVYEKCPIKSSLTRIIYCDGEVAGYLAIHFVQNYHEFTKLEEETLQVFARLLSLSISRYNAKLHSSELDAFKRSMSTIFALSEFDPIMVFDPENGKYEWLMNMASDVDNNTNMSLKGNNIYEDISKDIVQHLHPEDKERCKEFFSKKHMLELAKTGSISETENRWFIKTEGKYRWKYNKASRMINDNGKVYMVVGVVDTTEKKEKEIQLERERANLELSQEFFSLEDNLESLYDVELDSGAYSVYLKGDFYKENVINKLKAPGDYFEDLAVNVKQVIHPDDREGLLRVSTRDTIRSELAEHGHFDFLYRVLTNDEPIWFKIRMVYKDESKKNIIIGVFNAKDDIETKQIKEQKSLVEESLTFTNFFLDTYVSAYYVNLDTLECQVYKRTGDLEKNYPIASNYIDSLKEYINRDVHPDDRAVLLAVAEPKMMKSLLQEKGQYTHIFRDIAGGVEKTYRMQVIKGASENHAAFGFIDITNETLERNQRLRELEESKKLIEGIASSYDLAYLVNLRDDSFNLLRIDEKIVYGRGMDFKNFTEAKEYFISVLPEHDRNKMRSILDYSNIRECLKKEHSFKREYRVPINGSTMWHELFVTEIDKDRVAICFAMKDVEITQKHLEQKRYNEYFALYEIDADTGMMKIVKDSPWYEISRAGTAIPFEPAMKNFANSLDGDAKEFFEQLSDLNYVNKLFAKEDKHTFAYRSNNVGKKDWVDCTSYVTLRHEDGTPAMFTFGFSLIDSLGVFRQELQVKYKDALDVATEEKRRNDLLHDIIHSGKWSFFVNAKDEIVKTVYSEEAMRIVDNDFSEGVKSWTDVLHPDDIEQTMKEFMATIKDHTCKTPYDVTYRMKDRHGVYHWFHSAGRIVRDDKGNGEFFGIHIDITSQIEDQLEQHRQLEAARQAADAANKSKSNFLFNMSHDIRTPMNAIRGFTAMAKKYSDDKEKVQDYLDKIDVSGNQLLNLINQVLEMARIESGKIEFNEKPFNIKDEYHSMVTILSEQAKGKGLTFNCSISDIKHNHILADETRIGSITLNLVGNAMKYTPEGGEVRYEIKEITSRKPGYATFVMSIIDNGIGMSEEYLKTLYEPFSREKSSTVSKIQGTGLGMSIVKNLIDLMGGNIEVQSKLGEGTRFDVTLDFKIDKDAKEAVEEDIIVNVGSFKGRRILLVEDNEMNREIATDLLQDYGFVVESASDGDEAVSMIRKHFAAKEFTYYDFVLMDIQMPRMNGYEATRLIRKIPTPKGVHLPIIAMTANAFDEDRNNALEAGMDEHCSKPINLPMLLKTLAMFVKD